MRIAIIGGTLFIGHAAAQALIRRGHEVAVLHRGVHPEGQTPSMRERAQRIAGRMGRTVTFEDPEEPPEAWGLFGTMPNDVVVDSSAIRAALGFEEPLDEGARLDDLIAGLRASRTPG